MFETRPTPGQTRSSETPVNEMQAKQTYGRSMHTDEWRHSLLCGTARCVAVNEALLIHRSRRESNKLISRDAFDHIPSYIFLSTPQRYFQDAHSTVFTFQNGISLTYGTACSSRLNRALTRGYYGKFFILAVAAAARAAVEDCDIR